ncbi:MAG: ligase 1, partial [Kribbellaceae bacterium]|nr:ligase 1 [Kribbellaceae bacterium]
MLLADVVATSTSLSQTRSRRAKADLIATLLTTATEAVETEIVVTYLSGELRQRRTGVGWRTLADAPAPAESPSLTIEEVDQAFAELSEFAGAGSQARRREAVDALFGRATEDE